MAKQNDNTVLCKADLKAYHEKILPYLGGNMMMSTNNSDYYSTDEKVVGVWTDGRPLYQKTIHTTAPSTAESWNYVASLGETCKIVSYSSCILEWSNIGDVPIAFSEPFYLLFNDMWSNNTHVKESYGYINVYIISEQETALNAPLTITVQYTKTTDTASTALTTPGAYDINFPNTWPENKEIYFGNGVYGVRCIGVMNVGTTATDTNTGIVLGNSAKIINTGGNIYTSNYSTIFPTPSNFTLIAMPWVNYNASGGYTKGGLYIQHSAPQAASYNYDIWMTYTK